MSDDQRRQHDQSRSSGTSSGKHWYGLSGGGNPLSKVRSQSETTSRPQVKQTGGVSRARKRVVSRQRRQANNLPEQWVLFVIGGALFGLIAIVGIFLVIVLNADSPTTANAKQPTLPPPVYSQAGDSPGAFPTPAFDPLSFPEWNGQERFTLLVMGLDNRPGEENACRSDTIMIVSLDPQSRSIGILSIPRDVFVDVPEFGLRQINQVCTIGNLNVGNGPELMMQTIQYNFGIPVHDYFMMDFFAFIKFIDHLNGVTVNVAQPINDPDYPDMNYGTQLFYLEAGEQQLDGETALKYARSRHTSAGGDIDRIRRQQQLITAIRSKLVDAGMLDNLLASAPSIWRDLEAGIDTGLEFEQIIELILFARNISASNINTGVLGSEYLRGYEINQQWELVPRRDEAFISLMKDVFGEGYNQ